MQETIKKEKVLKSNNSNGSARAVSILMILLIFLNMFSGTVLADIDTLKTVEVSRGNIPPEKTQNDLLQLSVNAADDPNSRLLISQVDEALEAGKSVLIYFYLDECHFCEVQKPIIEKLELEFENEISFIYIDGSVNPQTVKLFDVSGFPTMFLIVEKEENGYKYKRFDGYTQRNEILDNTPPEISTNIESYSQVQSGLSLFYLDADEILQNNTFTTMSSIAIINEASLNIGITTTNVTYTEINANASIYETIQNGDENVVLPLSTTATLSGVLHDEYNNPIQGATVMWVYCNEDFVTSVTTNSNGEFSLTADGGYNYKLKVVNNGVIYTISVNGEECPYYGPNNYYFNDPIIIATHTTLSGIIHDEFGDPIQGATVIWTYCNDNYVTSVTTNSNGEFSLTADGGYNYKLKIINDGITYPIDVNGEECPYYSPGDFSFDNPLIIATQATLNGIIHDEFGDPIQGATVTWRDCNDNIVTSDTTNSNGEFSLTAEPENNYMLKVVINAITYLVPINGENCPYYGLGVYTLQNPIELPTKTTFNGYIKDFDDNPIEYVTVELSYCSESDVVVASDITDSLGYFSIFTDAGLYNIVLIPSEGEIPEIKLVHDDGDCYGLVGDVSAEINIATQCSQLNYRCWGEDGNIKLFGCYHDEDSESCRCYGTECTSGCTDGNPDCDSTDAGYIYVDVDNANYGNNPLPGAKIYLDGEYIGSTNSQGKKTLISGYGSRNVMVECPDGTYCSSKSVIVDGDEYLYFDCGCGINNGDLQVNVDNINGYPIANVYIFVNGEEMAITNPFGYAYLENIPYGNHHIDIRYRITHEDDEVFIKNLPT
ncbi:MAG: thioredoxin domain-containing protein [Halobacteriota archaeon]|nr:thioredoxin domain-containing protein [Halobacteriota archaeon]